MLSFQAWSPLHPPTWVGWDNYYEMLFDDDVFWQALWNTLIFMSSQAIGVAIAFGIALLVNSDLRGAAVYRTIVFLSYPLMTVAVAIIWRWMYNERGGLINFVLPAPHRQPADRVSRPRSPGLSAAPSLPTPGRCSAFS